jgi:pimeloyl-ACP methyl ester carboxylesterase
MESGRLETRLGPLAWQSSGRGPTLVFFAGALANHELWCDVIAALQDRYRCVTVDLPLGGHPWPLHEGADRSAVSLARLLPDCLELLDVDDATVVVNDTAGFRPQLLLDAAREIPRFDRPVLLIWGEECRFFPPEHARRLASDFHRATLVPVPGARTWIPVDNPAAVADAIAGFVPAQVP